MNEFDFNNKTDMENPDKKTDIGINNIPVPSDSNQANAEFKHFQHTSMPAVNTEQAVSVQRETPVSPNTVSSAPQQTMPTEHASNNSIPAFNHPVQKETGNTEELKPPHPYPQGNQAGPAPYNSGYFVNPSQPPLPPHNYPPQASAEYPNPYATPPYGTPYPQMPADFYKQYYPAPPKQKMSGGLKALIIIIIAILVACVVGFTAYLAYNSKTNGNTSATNPTNGFGNFGDYFGGFGNDDGGFSFGIPDSTSPTFSQEQSDKNYEKSDASKKTDPDFKGVELEEKPKDKNNEKYNASYTYNSVEKAVVGIACYYEEDKDTNTYQSQGTGIIITSDGYIVTNSHVIGNSRKAYLIKVITADKREFDAGVVGYDSRSDLAVLKIEASGLPVAKFGDSTYTEITEEVVAIGNPSGIEFQNSVTKGIVSALDRKVSTSNNVEFIQIDAAINPGNSGGPLCNLYGQVIGINTAKIASESFEGMGFAIPSATVKKVVDDIIRNSYVTNRVKVGITGQAVYASQAGVDGIQIVEIAKDGPMDGTGAQQNDIIVEVDGEKTTTFAEIFDVLEKHKEGDKVKIKLYRPSEKKNIEIEVKLQMDKSDQ